MSAAAFRTVRRAVFLVLIGLLAVPARAQADGDAIAIVNGKSISRARLVDHLIEAHGLGLLQQMILAEVAKQEAGRRKLRVTPGDVEAEYQRSLNEMVREAGMDPDESSDENKRKALLTVLEQRGVSLGEFMITMERNAALRKLAEIEIKITEDTLREEFARTHGERAVVRRITLAADDAEAMNGVVSRLRRGEDFAEVARALSVDESGARGGEMEPFTFTDDRLPAAFRERAFLLKADGEVTQEWLKIERVVHLLKRERRLPAEGVRFEDVRDQVERSLRDRVIHSEMNRLGVELFNKAKIRVIDSGLKKKYDEFQRKQQAG